MTGEKREKSCTYGFHARRKLCISGRKINSKFKAKRFFSYLYSAPHPLTKLIRMVHILVS